MPSSPSASMFDLLLPTRITSDSLRTDRAPRIGCETHGCDRELQPARAADHHGLRDPLEVNAALAKTGERHLQSLQLTQRLFLQNRLDRQHHAIGAGRVAAFLFVVF